MGAAALIACGGGDGSDQGLTVDPSSVRAPGAVVYQKDDWKLADETKQAVRGGVYPGYVADELEASWDPYLAQAGVVENFNDIGYEYLLDTNRGPGIEPGSDAYKTKIGALAEKYEVADGGLRYTFTLRPGVKFHPIDPVNAREMDIEDWRSSYQRFIEVGSNRAGMLSIVDRVEYPDGRHMVIHMKEPYAPFLKRMDEQNFAFKIVPRELNDDPELVATRLIGTNFRMVDKVQPSIVQEFKKWDGYWKGDPFIDRWHYPVIPEASNVYSQFVAQNIIGYTPTNQQALQLRQDAPDALLIGQEINPYDTPRGVWGAHDLDTSPWKDPRVRIALHRAVDHEGIANFQGNKTAFEAVGVPIEVAFTTHAPREPEYWLDPRKGELGDASENYLHDVAAARKLVEAAGYPDGFEIDVWCLINSREERQNLMLDNWKRFENDTKIRVNPVWKVRAEYYENLVYSNTFKGVQCTSGGSGGATDVDYVMFNNYYSEGRASTFPDPKIDEMVEAQRRELDPLKRAAIVKDWQKLVATLFPIQPTAHMFGTWDVEWAWLHNGNHRRGERGALPSHVWWLDKSMPRRDG
ncbi:MAG: hypothetical protein GEU75_08920 [Dehalococcoidia bacterium]|nr:hypothetical protein [Dehalococcoidia bacterium]